MSISVTSSVWKTSKQKNNALLMLLAIADNANDEGWAYPSIDTLASKVRVTRRNAQKIIDRLEAAGEVVVYNRVSTENNEHHYSNTYHLPQYGVANSNPPVELRGEIHKRSSVASDTRVVSPATPESSIEPSSNQKDSAPVAQDATGLANVEHPKPPRKRDAVFDTIAEQGFNIQGEDKPANGHIAALAKEARAAWTAVMGERDDTRLADALRGFYAQYRDRGVSPPAGRELFGARLLPFLQTQNFKPTPAIVTDYTERVSELWRQQVQSRMGERHA